VIKSVVQNHPMGCGVACVAAVLGLEYRKALHLFRRLDGAWTTGYFCPELVAALAKGGRCYSWKSVRNSRLDVLKRAGTIVFVQKSSKYPQGHYLVRTSRGWMNPWANFPEISPARSAVVKRLPGRASHVIFQVSR
jgi:hypothetical protein